LPDNDKVGRKHAHEVAKQLVRIAKEVRVLELPGLPEKGDVSDWLEAGNDAGALIRLAGETQDYNSSDDTGDTDASDGSRTSKKENKNQADILYELASTHAEIFMDQDGNAHAFVPVDGHRECYQLQNERFHGWLTALYRSTTGKMPTSSSRQDAIAALTWDARGTLRDVFVRVAAFSGKIYIDPGTEEWDAIEVDDIGWRVNTQPSVAFRRSAGTKPLPLPQEGAYTHRCHL
jgi:hypothetical protein